MPASSLRHRPHSAPHAVGLLLAVLALTVACTGVPAAPDPTDGTGSATVDAGATPDPPSPSTDTASPAPASAPATPTPEAPDPAAIRTVDVTSLPWQWFENHHTTQPVDLGAPDDVGRTYTVGEPIYSDADGDGLEDLAVPIAQTDGNGYREQWHIWLAVADGEPLQVIAPIASTSRCGDAITAVEPTAGGFAVRELLREPIIDDHLDCATPGTFAVDRGVAVTHDGELTYPVDLADPRGWGGVCPSLPRTETGVVTVWAAAGPDVRASLTIDGEDLFVAATHPHALTEGTEPMVLVAVWPPDGSYLDRLCVWVDPDRLTGAGE
ncbi:hypothetical protein C8046_00675 [Serinibacter arcticus]|uniref:Secreted protein n=1 Tax=Serinibacter arcticus TaxID=1655435 RepID=A0A2U1ZRB2_9MICO|nr:hypothetical protein [Serinibacter arcticus]PWD49452.1 hypothetical protein C8046_00675 [Serinibacter arcticus]